MKKSVLHRFCMILLIASFGIFVPTFAQSEKITLDITLSPALENAQILGLSSLGVDSKGSGPLLIRGSLVNNTNEELNNLYFEFLVEAGKVGVIARITQQATFPFSLDPGQVVFATNNDIVNEQIPGITDKMKFDGGLTVEGDDFIENLGSVSTLPNDIYSINVTIYQVTNALGKQVLATETVILGGSNDGVVVDDKSIFLRTPGDVVGTDISITNPFPQFSWEGDAANTFRLIVVRANGQDTPETLIQSARSSDPTQNENGVSLGGSLLQFENLDLLVKGNTIQYPSSGAQALQEGQTYYWQVTTEVQTSADIEQINSDIWTFKLSSPGDEANLVQIDQDTFDGLIRLIGSEQFASLTETGFSFSGIEINNQIVTGSTALLLLEEIIQKIEDGDIILNSNQ